MRSSPEGKKRNKSRGEEHGKGKEEERAVKWQGRDSQSSGYGREELSGGHVSNPVDGEKESGGMEEPLA